MKIVYWSDFQCPWCWIGEARLKHAVEAMPELGKVEYEMKAFRLNPRAGDHAVALTRDRLISEDGMSPKQADEKVRATNAAAQAEGLEFNYGTSLATNTESAHRLVKLAYSKNDPELYDRVITALFKLYFTDNKELADKELLKQTAVECGMDGAEVETFLAGTQYRKEVWNDEWEAECNNIHGVPFFVIGDYAVPGAASTDDFKTVLKQVLKEQTEAESPKSAGGMHCGPDGCCGPDGWK